MSQLFYTVAELAASGRLPDLYQPDRHLICNTPAALDFNSPGAQGFGVKRAALAIPGSVVLLIAPRSCGRCNAGVPAGEIDRFAWLLLDETDIVTGRHLATVAQAAAEFVRSRRERPSLLMLCVTCVDALLGTDMDRVARQVEAAIALPTRPCYMYALTRDSRQPPMTLIRDTLYSLLAPRPKNPRQVNLLGYFAPVESELPDLLRAVGVESVRELSTCATFDEYRQLAAANVNLVLNHEARSAAAKMSDALGIPFIELRRLYQLDKIRAQYAALFSALGATCRDDEPYSRAASAVERLVDVARPHTFGVGSRLNANAFELSLALTRCGLRVSEIYADAQPGDLPYLRRLAALSPSTRVYSNLAPAMLGYAPTDVTVALGADAAYHNPRCPRVLWNDADRQPFGYAALARLATNIAEVLRT